MTSVFSSSQKLPSSVSSVEVSPGSRVTMLGRTYHKAALAEDVKKDAAFSRSDTDAP